MDENWYNYFLNDLENMEYRLEDVILHCLTGVIMGITLKIKSLFKKLRSFFKALLSR